MEDLEHERRGQDGSRLPAGLATDEDQAGAYPNVINAEDHDPQGEFEEEHGEDLDYQRFSKRDFIDHIRELAAGNDAFRADRMVREVRGAYEELREQERHAAMERFIQDGGVAEDFEYKGDELDQEFDAITKQIHERKTEEHRKSEAQRQDNLRHRQELLERMRTLLDGQDTSNQFDQFKELQREWKTVGPVVGIHSKTLWASYHALVDRFYDNRSIYFELKELDRKKNLEAKLELCQRAEHLLDNGALNHTVRELNELHHEFKHIGPVPIEEKEPLWVRFKAASDAIYSRRDEYMGKLRQELEANLQQKARLCDEVEGLATFASDRIKDWNTQTRKVLDIQKKWESVKGLPRNRAREINKRFWSSFKNFFANKSHFFKKLDQEREGNLQKKIELVRLAVEMRESDAWEATAEKLKGLQRQWKEIGPVPEKLREKVYGEFKEACDHFFNRKRTEKGEGSGRLLDNLKTKESIIDEMEKDITGGTCTTQRLEELERRFLDAGFVPKKDVKRIREGFAAVMDRFLAATPDVDEDEKGRFLVEHELKTMRHDPNGERKIAQREHTIRRQISKIENDIALWRNNLEFFAASRKADQLREEFNGKIRDASHHLSRLKQELRVLRTA